MICEACREHRHEECRGGSWCDCQHKPPADEPGTASGEGATGEDDGAEPGVNWLRQG
jgi:hypothetical protein